MQDRETDHHITFIADNDIIIGYLAVSRVAGLFKIHIQCVHLGIERQQNPRLQLRPVLLANPGQLKLLLPISWFK